MSLALAFSSTSSARDGGDIAVGRAALISTLLLASLIAFERTTDLGLPKWQWPMLDQRPPVSMAWLGFPMSMLALMTWAAAAHLLKLGCKWRTGLFVALIFGLSLFLESATNTIAIAAGGIAFIFVFWFPRLLPLALIAVVAATIILPLLPSRNTARLVAEWNISTNLSGSLQHRMIVWNFSQGRFLDRPLFGWDWAAPGISPAGQRQCLLKSGSAAPPAAPSPTPRNACLCIPITACWKSPSRPDSSV